MKNRSRVKTLLLSALALGLSGIIIYFADGQNLNVSLATAQTRIIQ